MPSMKKKLVRRTAIIVATVAVFVAARTDPFDEWLRAGTYVAVEAVTTRINAARHEVWVIQSPSMIEEYVREHTVRKLQIGAGETQLPGWLNSDIERADGLVYVDATKTMPLEDGSFHYVFSEHVIEHLGYAEGMHMLKETYRILAPGGKVRIATPNLLQFVALFQQEKTDEMQHYLQGKLAWHGWPKHATSECFILNLQMRSFGHRFLYDPETLKVVLTGTGFESLREFKVGESDDPHLRGIEQRRKEKWIPPLNDYETMIFQAVKP